MNMISSLPSGKITAVMVAGAIAYVLVLLFQHYVPDAYRLSEELATAIPFVSALVAGYLRSPDERDVAKVVE